MIKVHGSYKCILCGQMTKCHAAQVIIFKNFLNVSLASFLWQWQTHILHPGFKFSHLDYVFEDQRKFLKMGKIAELKEVLPLRRITIEEYKPKGKENHEITQAVITVTWQ